MSIKFFVSGTYGVGKSTLCKELSSRFGIPFYNASDLISEENNENYKKAKMVSDKYENQNILVRKVTDLSNNEDGIILSGHFCIIDANNNVERLPDFVYKKLNLETIIIITDNPNKIKKRLLTRDRVEYDSDLVDCLQKEEIRYAHEISDLIGANLIMIEANNFNNVMKMIEHIEKKLEIKL